MYVPRDFYIIIYVCQLHSCGGHGRDKRVTHNLIMSYICFCHSLFSLDGPATYNTLYSVDLTACLTLYGGDIHHPSKICVVILPVCMGHVSIYLFSCAFHPEPLYTSMDITFVVCLSLCVHAKYVERDLPRVFLLGVHVTPTKSKIQTWRYFCHS